MEIFLSGATLLIPKGKSAKSALCVFRAAWEVHFLDPITCATCKVSFSIGLCSVSLLTFFIHSTFDFVNTRDCVTPFFALIMSRNTHKTLWLFRFFADSSDLSHYSSVLSPCN